MGKIFFSCFYKNINYHEGQVFRNPWIPSLWSKLCRQTGDHPSKRFERLQHDIDVSHCTTKVSMFNRTRVLFQQDNWKHHITRTTRNNHYDIEVFELMPNPEFSKGLTPRVIWCSDSWLTACARAVSSNETMRKFRSRRSSLFRRTRIDIRVE